MSTYRALKGYSVKKVDEKVAAPKKPTPKKAARKKQGE